MNRIIATLVIVVALSLAAHGSGYVVASEQRIATSDGGFTLCLLAPPPAPPAISRPDAPASAPSVEPAPAPKQAAGGEPSKSLKIIRDWREQRSSRPSQRYRIVEEWSCDGHGHCTKQLRYVPY